MRHLTVIVLLALALFPGTAARALSMDRQALLASWTQPTAASTAAWRAARLDQARWAEHGFDWSSDLCTRAPDTPAGFDFRDACRRHDFGYRNYRADLARHKNRIDEAFRADLRRICDGRALVAQPFCNSIAFAYHEAVRLLIRA